MPDKIVTLSVPAEADFARSVRMIAANLAVVAGMNVDEVEDVRMAAEEGFVYCCSTLPPTADIAFTISEGEFCIDFVLGDGESDDFGGDDGVEMIELLLSSVCDDYGITDDDVLHLVKQIGGADGE